MSHFMRSGSLKMVAYRVVIVVRAVGGCKCIADFITECDAKFVFQLQQS